MTVDITEAQKAKGTQRMESSWHRKHKGIKKTSNSAHYSRKPPGMEGKCMRCGKHAKNAKYKACSKIGHFHKLCMTTKKQQGGNRMVANIQVNQEDPDAFVN